MDLWNALAWIGRISFVVFFLMSGVNHLMNVKALAGYAQSKHVPAPALAVVVSGLMLLAGGVLILLGWHGIVGAALLVAFLLTAAFKIHNYWAESDAMMKANQMAHFWKNITIAAALVLYAVARHRGGL